METQNESDPNTFANKGVWIFVGIDLAIFGVFFLVFLVERRASPEIFAQSQLALNTTIGFLNTLILITSSWLLVMCIRAMVENKPYARNYLLGSIFFGFAFLVFKIFEYQEKFAAGIGIVENTYFTFYYLLTFIHFCHVIGGLIALFMVLNSMKKGFYKQLVGVTQSIGIYWHMVDLIWVYLFLILYLLR